MSFLLQDPTVIESIAGGNALIYVLCVAVAALWGFIGLIVKQYIDTLKEQVKSLQSHNKEIANSGVEGLVLSADKLNSVVVKLDALTLSVSRLESRISQRGDS